ncbi:antibiotic biosynthesis monooxygenase [Phormidesmis priestleyi ULC007]|uniref:Antibiotic biosynthesis monooxygenase n=1 Tax=Phormidesmis priestleyi ULC007 TaxID=1920490 RepID=A0A2T1DG84_9CYAN|nr:antibiotic biosynthesis monooxygenase [Phormidesmis priestleyi]PSB19467.1 antibiotic biosynthesis monooxygenase [Phormidesmis priestleyi ULC007]PZO53093.1 MAG: antibiotic biosynthesis monooxygenase [Phormidesmis priestleyi]
MILEVAVLDVKPGLAPEFETTFKAASAIVASMPGYISHQLQRCIKTANRYILLVYWNTLDDYIVGFRSSAQTESTLSQLQQIKRLVCGIYRARKLSRSMGIREMY